MVRFSARRTFLFDAEPAGLWDVISQTDQYVSWWPWLRQCDLPALEVGRGGWCLVRSPLSWSVRFRLELVEVIPQRLLAAELQGDLVGQARIDITATDHGVAVTLASDLTVESRALAVVTRVAPAVARWGHDQVLDAAEEQFARALARTHLPPSGTGL